MTDGLVLETLGLGLVVSVCDNVSSLVVLAALVVFCMFIVGGLVLALWGSSCVLVVLFFCVSIFFYTFELSRYCL